MNVGIGELSRRAGLKVETIRFYEREGLVDPPRRSSGGHRRYGEEALRRLRFIRRSRQLGFTLGEVRELLALARGPDCREVETLTRCHLAEVRRKIVDLRRLEETLEGLASQCRRDHRDGCPIIDALTGSASRPEPESRLA